MQRNDAHLAKAPLYRPEYEHDACGTGFVADLSGVPSHRIVAYALEAVVNLTHRGAVDADAKTGDGAGITIQLPRKLLAREVARLTGQTIDPAVLAAGLVFLPQQPEAAAALQEECAAAIAAEGLTFLGWRVVPVNPDVLGQKARETMPTIRHLLVARPERMEPMEFERRLYLARRRTERFAKERGISDFFVPSLSCRTLVYKGLFVARDLAGFYLDLQDPELESALALFHQRYSTNTFPTWHLAQPFRRLAHNGEINTLQGNRNWMRAREPELCSDLWGERIRDLLPVIEPTGSDSLSLDNVLELLELSGRELLHAVAMLVPAAWEHMPHLDEALRGFYAYHACLMEPWDGPAAIAFTDGRIAGAVLDRNGLRPARYTVTEDGLVVLASETGVIDLRGHPILERGRLGPGQMLAVDVQRGLLWHDDEIKAQLAAQRPYEQWVKTHTYHLSEQVETNGHTSYNGHELTEKQVTARQVAFGFSAEDQRLVIHPMAAEAKEPVWSMGDDAPLAVLSRFPRPLAHFFRQRFAQVTNPPIDPLREKLVMALDVYLGPRQSLLTETPEHARLLHLPSPVLTERALHALVALQTPELRAVVLPAVFPVADGPDGLMTALEQLLRDAEAAVDHGATILVLSDRGVDAEHAPIPMPLAVGGLHHHLIRVGKRMRASIVCDTGDV
ncbi:MAG: glutamate synthase subunit alpha, partial [Thermorudis peleae]|nr:glutamate synthase subunit alpha [Thermorudis peleae]